MAVIESTHLGPSIQHPKPQNLNRLDSAIAEALALLISGDMAPGEAVPFIQMFCAASAPRKPEYAEYCGPMSDAVEKVLGRA